MRAIDGRADSPDRICTSCSRTTPEVRFKPRGAQHPGRYHSMCNVCLYQRYTKPWAERQAQLIQQHKLDHGCADCGYREHPAALEFDHLPGSVKLFNIGEQMGNRSMAELWAEAAKCDVVCANCHNIRTFNRREQVRHGQLVH